MDHKTVAAVREGAEATREIPQLDKTIGRDGKGRRAPEPAARKVTYVDDSAANLACATSDRQASFQAISVVKNNNAAVGLNTTLPLYNFRLRKDLDAEPQIALRCLRAIFRYSIPGWFSPSCSLAAPPAPAQLPGAPLTLNGEREGRANAFEWKAGLNALDEHRSLGSA